MFKVKIGTQWWKLAFEDGVWQALPISAAVATSIGEQRLKRNLTEPQQEAIDQHGRDSIVEEAESVIA